MLKCFLNERCAYSYCAWFGGGEKVMDTPLLEVEEKVGMGVPGFSIPIPKRRRKSKRRGAPPKDVFLPPSPSPENDFQGECKYSLFSSSGGGRGVCSWRNRMEWPFANFLEE
ncbi:hypothetical protein JTE90_017916 [Oedothorax gibbosus]|uniref:Uncharacterized protein n=1 Tax=Oedothorax gibbosus TaxID=931172 RepID=A0AAV6VGI2_9ARAC|nr:hypothetical protein JTE90_017916 [Oedothorax gibbosus]